MRISTTQIYTEANRNMMEGQSELAKIQNKISSGKNFTSLTEDPVGANRVVNLKRELARFDTFQSNIDATRRRLALEETTISDINTALDRARELTIQAANNTLTDSDRLGISYEFEQIVDYVANLMNTRDAKGEYLFSGSKGTTQPYQLSSGRYSFKGDDGQREIQIAGSVYLKSTDSGREIFNSIKGDPVVSQFGLDASTSSMTTTVSDATLYEKFVGLHGDLTLTKTAAGLVTLTDSTGQIVSDVNNVPISGIAPAGGVYTIELEGSTLNFTLGAVGAAESTRITYSRDDTNILNALLDSFDALQTSADSDPAALAAFNLQMATMLGQLDVAQAKLSETTASIGARQKAVDYSEYSNTDFKLLTESTLSSIVDLDYAAASTDLAKRQLALQAAYASFAKIQGLSLFEYI